MFWRFSIKGEGYSENAQAVDLPQDTSLKWIRSFYVKQKL